MNSYLLRNLSGITSASIEKYLLFTGWVRDDTFNSTRMWVFKSKSDPEFKIAVPASEKATDFYPQVDISHILGNLITVIFNYQILRKPLKILSL